MPADRLAAREGQRGPIEPGRLLASIPAVFHSSTALRTILAEFDRIFFGGSAAKPGDQSFESTIANIDVCLSPANVESGALSWLAQWVALDELAPLTDEGGLRRLIPRIVPLYARRGTKQYLEELIRILTGGNPVIDDQGLPTFKLGSSSIGYDTRLGGDIPHWFTVEVRFANPPEGESERERLLRRLRNIIDLAKPAHTAYELKVIYKDNDYGFWSPISTSSGNKGERR